MAFLCRYHIKIPSQYLTIQYTLQVATLQNIGGKTNAQAIRRVAAACFGPEIAKAYMWHGMRGKQALKPLKIAKCVEEALACRGISQCDAALEMGNWLRHTCDRLCRQNK